jgi:hypothetical protein
MVFMAQHLRMRTTGKATIFRKSPRKIIKVQMMGILAISIRLMAVLTPTLIAAVALPCWLTGAF